MKGRPQVGLFDRPAPPAARYEAAAAAGLAAGATWVLRAVDALRAFLVAHGADPFLAETAKRWVLDRGMVDRPPDPRAWGAPFLRLKKLGLVVRAGSTSEGTANASPKPLWRRS